MRTSWKMSQGRIVESERDRGLTGIISSVPNEPNYTRIPTVTTVKNSSMTRAFGFWRIVS
uniref:Uncharacterized protein n=1 Tax=Daphnia magna TaxID=35525 RepID=A0A0P6GVQ6_9CRUS